MIYKLSFYLLLLLPLSLAAENDTTAVKTHSQQLLAAVPEMNEPELVLLIDSLLDCESDTLLPKLFTAVKARITVLRNITPEATSGDFPAHNLYGSWDTRHLFAYSDSLYRADTLVELNLGRYCIPVKGRITSQYGWRDSAMHRGIDIDLQRGDTVHAAFGGRVRFAGRSGGYGNVVVVRHENGLETLYAHLWRITVKPGDNVAAGAMLGRGGATGHATGTHLHFEIRFRGMAINPAWILQLPELQLQASQVSLVRTREGFAVRPAGGRYHHVQRGDTPARIARRYGRTTAELRNWNGWDRVPTLKAGQQILIAPPEAKH